MNDPISVNCCYKRYRLIFWDFEILPQPSLTLYDFFARLLENIIIKFTMVKCSIEDNYCGLRKLSATRWRRSINRRVTRSNWILKRMIDNKECTKKSELINFEFHLERLFFSSASREFENLLAWWWEGNFYLLNCSHEQSLSRCEMKNEIHSLRSPNE